MKDIKDQLAYNHAEGAQQVKWEAHALSPPTPTPPRQYAGMLHFSAPLMAAVLGVPEQTPQGLIFPTCRIKIMQWSGSTVDPLARIRWSVTSAGLKIKAKLDYFSTKY